MCDGVRVGCLKVLSTLKFEQFGFGVDKATFWFEDLRMFIRRCFVNRPTVTNFLRGLKIEFLEFDRDYGSKRIKIKTWTVGPVLSLPEG